MASIAVLLPLLAFVSLDAHWWYEGIQTYNALDRGVQAGSLRGPTGVPSRSLFYNPDAFVWNRLAMEVAEGRALRVRRTGMDNHPAGREVHWHSGLLWMIAAAGWVWRFAFGSDLQTSLERASLLLNPLLAAAVAVATFALLRRRAGPLAAVVVLLALFGSPAMRAFHPGGVDHHGLIVAAAFLTVLFLILGGAGLGRGGDDDSEPLLPAPGEARAWFIASAVAGAAGLWVSAFSQVVVLAGVVLGGLLTLPWLGRGYGVAGETPALWRTWGRAGLLASLAFYLLEYFPGHLGLRFEVNHPLHGLAWWGAAELLACAAAWRLGTGPWLSGRERLRAAAAGAAVLAVPAAVWVGGSLVMLPLDPLMLRLHKLIFEFAPMRPAKFASSFALPLVAAFLAAAVARRGAGAGGALTAFAAGCAAILPLTLLQNRWSAPSAALLAALLLPAAAQLSRRIPGDRRSRAAGAALLLAVCASFALTAQAELTRAARMRDLGQPHPILASFSVVRDVAEAVRAQSATSPVVLSTPWPTLVFAYASGGSGLGTLYWENGAGIAAALDILTAHSEPEALRLVRERGVTHVLLLRHDTGPRRMLWLRNGSVRVGEAEATFASALLGGWLPRWLERMPYLPARNFGDPRIVDLLLYRVRPEGAPGAVVR